MLKYWRCLPVVLMFVLFGTIDAQVPAQAPQAKSAQNEPTATKPDYSKEAFVDEQDLTKIVFENDGTSTRETSARIRIQSDAGAQRYGVMTFPYQNAVESIDIDYVRVRKPDGTVITTPADNIQDMPAEITRQAPFYSDLREKHVAVKGLSVGDVLETQAHWHTTKPLAPGQFWYAFNFSHDFIVLDEELRISVPRERAIKWKSLGYKPDISEEGSRRIFTWKYSQLEQKSADERKKQQEEQAYQLARGRLSAPEVQISTFQSWEEIGAWYNKLQLDRVKPNAEIQAKAAELTKNAADDNAKLRAIYNYVSTQFRYIGVAFGIGRYQPHSAAEVLANQYGDCKDKHTLLASLLEAAGVKAYPALINSTRELDPEVPSPAQFDHVITAVPQGNGYAWLDTTAEVAPYGYLISLLWDKQALVIPVDKSATLITTPAEPPTKASETFHIDAKLKDDGTLEGKVERTVSGDDAEVLLRAAFRRVPMPQWKDLVQQISYASGFSGDVSDVSASLPEKTDEAFRFSYSYTRKDFPQWSEKRIASALPPLLPAAVDEKPSHPILLGVLGQLHYESMLEVPKGYSPQLPKKVSLSEPFADYEGSYAMKDGMLRTERRLVVKAREVPLSEYEAYKTFSKAVADDHEVYVGLMQKRLTPTSYQEAVWALPDSDNADANRSYDEARNQYNNGDTEAEIAALKHAVEVDPKFTRAWLWMSEIYMYQRKPDLGLDALRSAIANDSRQPLSYKGLGFALMGMRKFEDAIPVWQQLMTMAPDDSDGPANLGSVLFALKRYADAASAVESAIKLTPDRAPLYMQLGSACIRGSDEDKAMAAYKKALEMDPRPVMYNDIGYELADAGKQLTLSLQYAEKAVRDEEQASANVKLSDLKMEDLGHTIALAAFWDTLGWVHFKLGNLDQAERYLTAAWTLSPGGEEADHLLEVRRKLHKDAVLADSNQIRTTKLGRLVPGTASAEYFVVLVRDLKTEEAKVEEVKFISGSEKLKSVDKALSSAPFKVPFPDDGPTRLVRRGIVGCYSYTGCSFVVLNPSDVHSVN